MHNIITFPNSEVNSFRKKCCFMNRSVRVITEDGDFTSYPCIVLYDEETNIPIKYTGFERYVYSLQQGEKKDSKTLSIRAFAVCHFLNYLLKETNINAVHECSIKTVRDFLIFIRMKNDGEAYQRETWIRYRDYVMTFLCNYYYALSDSLPFQYKGLDLRKETIVEDDRHHKTVAVAYNSAFNVKRPKKINNHHKNRVLVYGYLELLLYEAKKYEPDIVLGIALGAFAGLREGEVVNLTCGSIKIIRRGLGMISKMEIDLENRAPFFENWQKKTNPGSIKKKKNRSVYKDFLSKTCDLYDEHLALMESKGISIGKDDPLFVNKQRNPMTVQTYSARVKTLFYERFLPALKRTCEQEGTYADNAAFIEAYEREYPGAHMFRHWFTMYLITKAHLERGEIMKLRGDDSEESMKAYIHENDDLIKLYRESAYTFQASVLEDAYNV